MLRCFPARGWLEWRGGGEKGTWRGGQGQGTAGRTDRHAGVPCRREAVGRGVWIAGKGCMLCMVGTIGGQVYGRVRECQSLSLLVRAG